MSSHMQDASGVLGANEESNRFDYFTKVSFEIGKEFQVFQEVAAGSDHFLACTTAGDIITWGNGEHGQLGRKIMERRKRSGLRGDLIRLPWTAEEGVKKRRGDRMFAFGVGAGEHHSLAIDSDGRAYAWGLNNHGQCGQEPGEPCHQPMLVPGLEGVKIIKACGGEHHSMLLSEDGHVYTFGKGDYGQLGFNVDAIKAQHDIGDSDDEVDEDEEHSPEEIRMNFRHGYGTRRNDGAIMTLWLPTRIPTLERITDISCGGNHNLAIDENARVYSWGSGELYELGNREEADRLVPDLISTSDGVVTLMATGGSHHTCLLIKRTQ